MLLTNCHLWSPGSEKNSLLPFTVHILHFLHRVLTALMAPRRKSHLRALAVWKRPMFTLMNDSQFPGISLIKCNVRFDLFHFYLFHGLNTQKLKKK